MIRLEIDITLFLLTLFLLVVHPRVFVTIEREIERGD